jgi:hypothetical protein
MSDNVRLAVPRQLWRQALPDAPDRVIRALESLTNYFDDSGSRTDVIINEIAGQSNAGISAIQQIPAIETRIDDLESSFAAAMLNQGQSIQQAIEDAYMPPSVVINEADFDVPAMANPDAQAAAQFLANATPITFTPTVIGLTAAGAGTYSYQLGSGQLIGNRFYFSMSIAWTAHTGTGGIAITGLPFTALNTANRLSALSLVAENMTFTGQLSAYVLPNENRVRLAQLATGAALAAVAMDTAATIHINGFYEV